MCAGCMGTADFVLTGGVLGVASLKVAGRRLLPGRWDRDRARVTDAEVDAFVTRVRGTAPAVAEPEHEHRSASEDGVGAGAPERQSESPSAADEPGSPEGAPVLV